MKTPVKTRPHVAVGSKWRSRSCKKHVIRVVAIADDWIVLRQKHPVLPGKECGPETIHWTNFQGMYSETRA